MPGSAPRLIVGAADRKSHRSQERGFAYAVVTQQQRSASTEGLVEIAEGADILQLNSRDSQVLRAVALANRGRLICNVSGQHGDPICDFRKA